MSVVGEFMARDIVPRDDARHEHGGDSGWSEWLSFAFAGADAEFGGIASVEFWPGEERAEGSVVLFLPGGNVAASMSRARVAGTGGTAVGRLQMYMDEAMQKWQIRCKDLALVLPAGSTLGERGGAAVQLDIDLVFEARGTAAGWAGRRSDVSEEGFLSVVSAGRFEQPGAVTGRARAGGWSADVSALGFRERGWGVRDAAVCSWLGVSFGPDLAVATSRARVSGADLTAVHVWRDGKVVDAALETEEPGVLVLDDGSERFRVAVEEVAALRPGAGDPPVARALARATSGARAGTAITLRPILL